MDGLKGVAGKHFRPAGIFGIGTVRHDPEALGGMVDDGDDFALGGCDWPGAAEEVEGVVCIDTALNVECQMEVQQWSWRQGLNAGTLF